MDPEHSRNLRDWESAAQLLLKQFGWTAVRPGQLVDGDDDRQPSAATCIVTLLFQLVSAQSPHYGGVGAVTVEQQLGAAIRVQLIHHRMVQPGV